MPPPSTNTRVRPPSSASTRSAPDAYAWSAFPSSTVTVGSLAHSTAVRVASLAPREHGDVLPSGGEPQHRLGAGVPQRPPPERESGGEQPGVEAGDRHRNVHPGERDGGEDVVGPVVAQDVEVRLGVRVDQVVRRDPGVRPRRATPRADLDVGRPVQLGEVGHGVQELPELVHGDQLGVGLRASSRAAP